MNTSENGEIWLRCLVLTHFVICFLFIFGVTAGASETKNAQSVGKDGSPQSGRTDNAEEMARKLRDPLANIAALPGLSAGAYAYSARPDGTADWSLKFCLSFIFPK